jgi:hypothetical protein
VGVSVKLPGKSESSDKIQAVGKSKYLGISKVTDRAERHV